MRSVKPSTRYCLDSIMIVESGCDNSPASIIYVNTAFTELTGYEPNELIGRSTEILQGPKSGQELNEAIDQVFRDGGSSTGQSIGYRKDDSDFIMQWWIGPLPNGKSDRRRAIAVQRNITEQHSELEQMARLGRASAIGEIAPDIVHEINQPLTAIQSYTQACVKRLESGRYDTAKLLDLMAKIAKNAGKTSEKLRQFGSAFRSIGHVRTVVDINEIVNQALKLKPIPDRAENIDFATTLATGLPKIMADPVQIQQVILNLILNAIESMEKSPIEQKTIGIVTTRPNEEHVQLSISDRGASIPDAVELTLFTPFVSSKQAGLGMGLPISLSIIQAHGGRLWHTPNEPTGTTFHFTLPILNL